MVLKSIIWITKTHNLPFGVDGAVRFGRRYRRRFYDRMQQRFANVLIVLQTPCFQWIPARLTVLTNGLGGQTHPDAIIIFQFIDERYDAAHFQYAHLFWLQCRMWSYAQTGRIFRYEFAQLARRLALFHGHLLWWRRNVCLFHLNAMHIFQGDTVNGHHQTEATNRIWRPHGTIRQILHVLCVQKLRVFALLWIAVAQLFERILLICLWFSIKNWSRWCTCATIINNYELANVRMHFVFDYLFSYFINKLCLRHD